LAAFNDMEDHTGLSVWRHNPLQPGSVRVVTLHCKGARRRPGLVALRMNDDPPHAQIDNVATTLHGAAPPARDGASRRIFLSAP
jgi:hypothetical protein